MKSLPPILSLTALAALLVAPVSQAAPYASAVTVTGDSVSFVLNESADSVKVVFNDGASTLVIGATPEPAGLKTFSKAGFSSFRIEVEKNAGPGWKSGVLQPITQDSNDLVKFANGRGIAVNRHPATGPLFGRIYASVGTPGTAAPVAVPPLTPRSDMAEGIYVLNPDFTATALGSGPLTGGLTFESHAGTTTADLTTINGTDSPYRLTVGENGDLFISDFSKTRGTVYKTDGNVANGKNVLGGATGSIFPIAGSTGSQGLHGSIAAVVTEGSEADGNLKLWVVDQDLQSNTTTSTQTMRNSIWLWEMNNEPLPMANAPTLVASAAGILGSSIGIGFAGQTCDLCRAPDGTFYKLQRRASGLESGIFALSSTGSPTTSHPEVTNTGSLAAFRAYSLDNTVVDPFLESVACDVSNDNWLAVLRRSDNAVHLVKTQDGKIDFATHILLYTAPTTNVARDVCFDSAGNLYTISSGQALLRVYAPGGHTRATTYSSGAFEISELSPTPPAPLLELKPVITGTSRVGNDLVMPFTSRLGIPGTIVLQQATDLELGPWTTLTTAATFTITGSPPNYTAKAIGAFGGGDKQFYRVRRN